MTNPEPLLNVERTVFFSDAVIAIAMTLLAIDLPLPEGKTDGQVWRSFAHSLGGAYLAFAISFVVIALFWYRHHRLFQRIVEINTRLVVWNLVALFAIVLVPFATKLLAAPPAAPPGAQFSLGPVIYASMILLWGAAQVMMVVTATRGRLWRPGTPSGVPGNMIFATCTALAMFAVSIPVAFVSPAAAEYCWLLIPVVGAATRRLRGRVRSVLRPNDHAPR